MVSPAPSRAVRAGYRLVTLLFVVAAVFGVVDVVSIGVGLARNGDSLLYGETLIVPIQLSPDNVKPLPNEVRVDSWFDARVEIDDPSSKQMLLRSAIDTGPLLLFIIGLWLVRGLLQSVMRGDPFGAANVRRLRRLGTLLVAGGLLVELLSYAFRNALLESVPSFGSLNIGMPGYALPIAALLGGLGAYILAEVFACGSQLREDAEATI